MIEYNQCDTHFFKKKKNVILNVKRGKKSYGVYHIQSNANSRIIKTKTIVFSYLQILFNKPLDFSNFFYLSLFLIWWGDTFFI